MRSTEGMPSLGASRHQRMISRIGFYLGVVLIMWAMGRLESRQPAMPNGSSDGELGVARAYIASPEMPEYARLPQGR
jgi:hypothetical protein